MTTLDLHPEELFDKAARGTISPPEQALLDAHLAQCTLCRFEHQATLDFAALPLPAIDVDRLVTSALTARSTRASSLRPRSSRGALLLAAAVALGAMGSFAAVGQWTGVLPRLVSALRGPAPVAPTPAEAPVPVRPPEAESTLPPLVEAVPAAPAPEVVPAAWPGRPTSVARAAPPPAVEARREAPPAAPAPPDGTAADVFSAATRARLGGDRPLAVARYRQLLASWPASEEAAQTRASLGRLLLDEGAPTAALELLDGYLRGPDGTLREEVLAARAQALSRLGRAAEEARAWQALVEQYPESIHATRGRYRLSSLSTPRPE